MYITIHLFALQVVFDIFLKKLWLGWKDLNPRMLEPESNALPLGDTPKRGVPGGIRTPDPRLRRAMLYPTELLAHIWLGWLDLNQRMRESKSRALPLGDTPTIIFYIECSVFLLPLQIDARTKLICAFCAGRC